MKNLIFSLLITVLCGASMSAQNDTYLHKNHGHYEVLDPNSVYYAQRIDLTTGQPVQDNPRMRKNGGSKYLYKTENCYRGFISAGYDLALKKGESGNVLVRTTHGYQATQNFFLGVGVGLDIPVSSGFDHTPNVPVYGAVRLQANHASAVPFVGCNIGYCFNKVFDEKTETDIRGGFYLHPEIGLNFVVADNLGLNLSVGYSFYRYKYDEMIDNDPHSFRDANYNRQGVTFSLGFEF